MFGLMKRNAPRVAPGEVNIDFILQDEALYEAFHAYCVTELAAENLNFLDLVLCKGYHRNLAMITENFVRLGSSQVINISYYARDDLLKAIAALRRDGADLNKGVNYSSLLRRLERAMDPVIVEVKNMLQFGALLRFRKTHEFRAALAARRRRRGVIRL